ncbi:MAG TPA: MG2 domain-containing protein, partial [Puia sp.]|nr:MG2 domain-containing protein [Puia sp.]
MVVLFCLAVVTGRGQKGAPEYAEKWKVVDSLITIKGLTQTALDRVNNIYAQAQREKNEPQLIKALVYRLRLEETRSEDGLLSSIKELEEQLSGKGEPETSILQNILAHLYLDYAQRNSNKLYDRTDTGPSDDKDIATWSMEQLNTKIRSLFLSSLAKEALLVKIGLNDYEPVVVRGNTPGLRPTLFDLLANGAIDYFQHADAWSGRYSGGFDMDDPAIFADAASFVIHHFRADTLAPQYEAIVLEQRLLRTHLGDANPDVLNDADIDRLVFANGIYTGDEKDSLYMEALKRLARTAGTSPGSDRAKYLLAREFANGASTGTDSTGYIRAAAICTAVLSQKDSTGGWKDCSNLLNMIRQRELHLETENVNIPHRPMRALVSWRNIGRFYWRIIRLDEPARWLEFNLYDNASLQRLLNQPVYRAGAQQLPQTGDYLEHRVEIALPSLPPGSYLLAAATDSNWRGNKGIISAGQFAVSRIAYMSRDNDWFVLDRETGRPLAGAKVQVWDRPDNARPGSELVASESYIADEHGHFEWKGKKGAGYRTRIPEINIPGDRLFPPQGGFYTQDEDETRATAAPDKKAYEAEHRACFLFTDRSIYRPGQEVFFKGILTTADFDTHRTKLLPGDSSRIILFNANDERIDSMELVADDYGSFHGRFRLPEGQLNGRFRIASEPGEGMQYLSVEEYKRPKYVVGFDAQKDSYRLGDSIHVAGWAKAYAGNGIDGGKVSWRVTRTSVFRVPRLYGRIPSPYGSEKVIAHGVAVTDARGRFTVAFPALPDRHLPRSTAPLFDYAVSADVTDITGETRSGSTTVVAGYAAVRVSIDVAGGDRLASDSLHTLVIHTGNLSGWPVAARVQVSVYALKAPQRLIRKRLWEAPDRFVLTEKQWLDSFPHDEYREETQKETWEKSGKIWETTVSCGEDGHAEAVIGAGTIAPGWYLVEAQTTDRFGQAASDEAYVECFDARTGKPGSPAYRWEMPDMLKAEPGATVSIASGSSADVYVIRTVQTAQKEDQVKRFGYFRMNAEKKDTSWTVKESDRGGFGITDAWIADNRLYTHFSRVDVPWTNKQLEINYSSYRDKTLPGSPEKWELRISGYQGERVAAEVLAAMYDASLDQFEAHGWSVPVVFPSFEKTEDWESRNNFEPSYSQSRGFDVYRPLNTLKEYDRLVQVNEPRGIMIRGSRVLRGGKWKDVESFANEDFDK